MGALAASALLLPSTALASTEASTDTSTAAVVTILLGIAGAYLIAHFVLEQLQRRLMLTSGVEYVILGALLGPLVLGVGIFDDLTPLAPIIALAAGWVGLLTGTGLDLSRLLQTRDGTMRLALTEAVTTGLTVALFTHWALASGLFGPVSPTETWLAAGSLGAASVAGSTSAVNLVTRVYELPEAGLAHAIRRTAAMSDLVAITAFGLLFCVFHTGPTAIERPVSPTEWAVITVGLGLILGGTFTLLLGDDHHPNSRFLALVGLIAFASGAAFFLHLSLLLVNLVLGAVLVNLVKRDWDLHATLEGTHKPMTLILLVFAGALWTPPEALWHSLGLAGAVVALRVLSKLAGGWLGAVGTPLRGDVARGLLAQGDAAVAMAIALRLVYEGTAVDVAYTAILVSVVLSELVAPRLLKGLLVDAGEIRHEPGATIEAAAAEGG